MIITRVGEIVFAHPVTVDEDVSGDRARLASTMLLATSLIGGAFHITVGEAKNQISSCSVTGGNSHNEFIIGMQKEARKQMARLNLDESDCEVIWKILPDMLSAVYTDDNAVLKSPSVDDVQNASKDFDVLSVHKVSKTRQMNIFGQRI